MTLSSAQYQANRLDLLSRLAGDISHEIKNPLHAMVINLELVRRKVEKGEPAQAIERVGIVEEEIRKVHALANGLLEALRPPRDASSICSFTAVFDEMLPLVMARARCARVELDVAVEPAQLLLPLAAFELRLLLLNLVDRGVRTAGPNGRISLACTVSGDQLGIEVVTATPSVDETEDAWLRAPAGDADHIDLGLRVLRDLAERSQGRVASAGTDDQRHRLSVALRGVPSA